MKVLERKVKEQEKLSQNLHVAYARVLNKHPNRGPSSTSPRKDYKTLTSYMLRKIRRKNMIKTDRIRKCHQYRKADIRPEDDSRIRLQRSYHKRCLESQELELTLKKLQSTNMTKVRDLDEVVEVKGMATGQEISYPFVKLAVPVHVIMQFQFEDKAYKMHDL